MAHQHYDHVKRLLTAKGIFITGEKAVCKPCILVKMHRQSHKQSKSKSNKIGESIHSDVCGPMESPSLNGSRYFVLFKDDYFHYRHIYFIKSKDQVTKCFENYLIRVKKETGVDINCLRTDNGLEFIDKQMQTLTFKFGIQHQRR